MLVKDTVESELVIPGFCDRCNARAGQIATKDNKNTGENLMLLFCAHHAREYHLSLAALGFSITEINS